MSYAGKFTHLLEACTTVQQCMDLANVANLAAQAATSVVMDSDERRQLLTNLTGLCYELGARTVQLERLKR